jgi:hypothetical protein
MKRSKSSRLSQARRNHNGIHFSLECYTGGKGAFNNNHGELVRQRRLEVVEKINELIAVYEGLFWAELEGIVIRRNSC